MKTDPNHESPDIIDQRTRSDWSGDDPLVLPGITLPTTLPAGWTLDENGGVVPPPAPTETPRLTVPELTITPSPSSSSSSSTGALVLLGLFAAGWAVVHFARGS